MNSNTYAPIPSVNNWYFHAESGTAFFFDEEPSDDTDPDLDALVSVDACDDDEIMIVDNDHRGCIYVPVCVINRVLEHSKSKNL